MRSSFLRWLFEYLDSLLDDDDEVSLALNSPELELLDDDSELLLLELLLDESLRLLFLRSFDDFRSLLVRLFDALSLLDRRSLLDRLSLLDRRSLLDLRSLSRLRVSSDRSLCIDLDPKEINFSTTIFFGKESNKRIKR